MHLIFLCAKKVLSEEKTIQSQSNMSECGSVQTTDAAHGDNKQLNTLLSAGVQCEF